MLHELCSLPLSWMTGMGHGAAGSPLMYLGSAFGSGPVGSPGLSREERFGAISEHWLTPMLPVSWAVAAFVVLAVLIMVLVGVRIYRNRHLGSAPLLTYHHLADRMGLSLRHQWLLVRLARRASLQTPITLLLAPGVLRHHLATWTNPPGRPVRRRLQRRLDTVGQCLFGDHWSPLAAVPIHEQRKAA